MMHVVSGRRLVGIVMVAALAAGVDAAAAQVAPLPGPAPAPAPAPSTPDRGRQLAADARYKVRVMEGVLEK
ncbi:MAG: hypothetical protein ACHQRO_15470, partial [Vicinamibacteria bacterium]